VGLEHKALMEVAGQPRPAQHQLPPNAPQRGTEEEIEFQLKWLVEPHAVF
jgi:hypothetical protein